LKYTRGPFPFSSAVDFPNTLFWNQIYPTIKAGGSQWILAGWKSLARELLGLPFCPCSKA
jgi:hypothetical protein